MKSFKWLLACIGVLIVALLFLTTYSTQMSNNSPAKTKVPPGTKDQDKQDIDPVHSAGIHVYYFY